MNTSRANVWTLAEVRDLLEPFGVKVRDTYEAALVMAYDPKHVPADSPAPHTVAVSKGSWTEQFEAEDDEDAVWER